MATVRRQTVEELIEVRKKIIALYEASCGKPKRKESKKLYSDFSHTALQLEFQADIRDFDYCYFQEIASISVSLTSDPVESAIKILAILGVGVTE